MTVNVVAVVVSEKPENCRECNFVQGFSKWCLVADRELTSDMGKPVWCPLLTSTELIEKMNLQHLDGFQFPPNAELPVRKGHARAADFDRYLPHGGSPGRWD
jgi:hypothetical protein